MGVIRWFGALLRWVFSLVLFLLMPWRWFRRRPAAVAALPADAGDSPTAESPQAESPQAERHLRHWPQMPRSGKPGSATDDQVEALMEARIVPAPPCRDLHDYSAEEAAAILDAIAFARAVATQVTGGEDAQAPPEVLTELLNDLVATTLADDELRDFALRWARGGQPTPIRENTTFAPAREAVLRHWQPAEAAAD
jgi:hypothetical protein